MNKSIITHFISVLIVCGVRSQAIAQSTAFTYQGRLAAAGSPAHGLYEMSFALYDAVTNGNLVGTPVGVAPVVVSNGLFTATLNFGPAAFSGPDRWLEITVNLYGSDMVPTTLAPRQPLTPTPYALHAAQFNGAVADSQLSANVARLNANQTFSGRTRFANPASSFTGTFEGNGAGVTNVNLATINSSGAISRNDDLSFISSSLSVGHAPYAVIAADINGDGRPDLVSANYDANTLSVLWNDGTGHFTLRSSPGVGDGPTGVVSADVNQDGYLDLISANFRANTLSVLLNDQTGGFALASSPRVGREPYAVAAADLNGDGYIDLVSANVRDDTLSVLTNDGAGGFRLAASPAVGDAPISVAAADVNGDGAIDLISANRDADTLSVLLNNGSAGFAPGSSPSVGNAPFDVTAADVNGDGHMDLISADLGDGKLSVLINDGSGGFVLASSPEAGGTPYAVTTADMNGDGRLDVICANQFEATLAVFLNNGGGNFTPVTTLPVDSDCIGVAAADLNGDGAIDLASANWRVDTLSVLLQNSGPDLGWHFRGTFTGNFSGAFSGNGSGLADLNADNLAHGAVPSAALGHAWKTEGNAGTSPGTHFLGTTDDQPLELKVNGVRALRLEPNGYGEPNMIGGSPANAVATGVVGATIAGGSENIISPLTTLVPDENNPGQYERVTGDGATVTGGYTNHLAGEAGTIGGGAHNTATGDYATLAGGSYNLIQADAFNSYGVTISGGSSNSIISSHYGTVAGGSGNSMTYGFASTISGGVGNQMDRTSASVIGGGLNNVMEELGGASVIAGGEGNRLGPFTSASCIGGGRANQIGFASANVTVAGGNVNTVGEEAESAVIAGGNSNRIEDKASYSSIGGGLFNVVQSNAQFAVVPGGFDNLAARRHSFAAGQRAQALHDGAFVWADSSGTAPDNPFAGFPFASRATNEFAARATGGVRFATAIDTTGSNIAGVALAPGGGAWSSLSDRHAKENFAAANTREILDKVAALPLASWNYKTQDKSIRHLGPMAQDFHTAFGLGESDRTITTVDADGVALAAIQGLNAKLEEQVKEKAAEIQELKRSMTELKELVRKLARQPTE